jgi:hypothetical protein
MLERNPHVFREAKHQADEKHHSLRDIAEELNARAHHIKKETPFGTLVGQRMLAFSWPESSAEGRSIHTNRRPDRVLALSRVAGAGSARKRESGVALFLPFRWVSTLSQRQWEWQLMTELAASAIALMLDVELAVAIACAVKWFKLRQANEARSAKQAEFGGVGTARAAPEHLWPALALNPPFLSLGRGNGP